mmetsp:Transcript_9399/g.18628  ORF Transcript_9399/g.18628 Transcript_9399/m.18628 type:complete len:266 (+) Transcript_9399:879-1676(+)
MEVKPPRAQDSRGLEPSLATHSISAPASTKVCAASSLLLDTAHISAVRPPIESLISRSAPCLIRILIASGVPFCAASIKGVIPWACGLFTLIFSSARRGSDTALALDSFDVISSSLLVSSLMFVERVTAEAIGEVQTWVTALRWEVSEPHDPEEQDDPQAPEGLTPPQESKSDCFLDFITAPRKVLNAEFQLPPIASTPRFCPVLRISREAEEEAAPQPSSFSGCPQIHLLVAARVWGSPAFIRMTHLRARQRSILLISFITHMT